MDNTYKTDTGFDFSVSENQRMVGQMAKDFAEKQIKPHVMEWDEQQHFPRELFNQLGELGMLSVFVPEEYGGSGFGYFEYVTVIQEIAKVCGSIGLSVAAHNSLCTGHIFNFANEEQKQKWLPKLATGEWLGAWGLTEANTGSDAMRMSTTAVLDGDHYIINGAKNWITHGKSSGVAVVMARTGEKGDSKGISAFVVERGTPGFNAGKKENKLGIRGSDTHTIMFNDVKVPKENRIGADGFGFTFAMKTLAGGRIRVDTAAADSKRDICNPQNWQAEASTTPRRIVRVASGRQPE